MASLRAEFAAQKLADKQSDFLNSVLSRRVVKEATYTDQRKRPCDPGTRVEILEGIRNWSTDVSDNSQQLLWLSGIPGSGKSAVTASFTRELNDAGCLWAQFFINRNDAKTLDPGNIFPSIARQLADHNHDIALHLHDVLSAQRSLVDELCDEQAQKLFVDAIKIASDISPSQPIVVVIDSLDEIDSSGLAKTARIISETVTKLPYNAKLLISSRTEEFISSSFTKVPVRRVELDTSANASIRDVTVFLTKGIQGIVEEYDLDGDTWPGDDRLQHLCTQASGLFIWATTALTYIRDQINDEGDECLDTVIDHLTTEGMEDINILYQRVLDKTYVRQMNDPWALETFQRVTGAILFLQEPFCLSDLAELLDLHKPGTTARVDLLRFVRRLRTILMAGPNVAIDGNTIPQVHKSFFDFITSERADTRFRISAASANTALVLTCFRIMKAGLRFNICHLETSHLRNDQHPDLASRVTQNIPKYLSYPCCFWVNHLQGVEPDNGILKEVKSFLQGQFLYWLEALSLLEKLPTASPALQFLTEWINVSVYCLDILCKV
jgi:hypothetical protein